MELSPAQLHRLRPSQILELQRVVSQSPESAVSIARAFNQYLRLLTPTAVELDDATCVTHKLHMTGMLHVPGVIETALTGVDPDVSRHVLSELEEEFHPGA